MLIDWNNKDPAALVQLAPAYSIDEREALPGGSFLEILFEGNILRSSMLVFTSDGSFAETGPRPDNWSQC